MFMLTALAVSFRDLVTDIPHDAASVVVYFMLLLFVAAIVRGSRRDPAGLRPTDD